IETGMKDASNGIIRLPLLQALLTVGSQMPVGGDDSPLTYVDLRRAANPDLMVTAPDAASTATRPEENARAISSNILTAPATNHTATPSPVGRQTIFIQTGTRAGQAVSHLIPQPIWDYIHRADILPDGWQTDF